LLSVGKKKLKIKELKQKYPKLLDSLIDGCISCNDGWYNLLDKLCTDIDQVFKDSNLPEDKYPLAAQVKQKFGVLRFYMETLDPSIFDQIDQLIQKAEEKSGTICEICGEVGQLFGWNCLCNKCKPRKEMKCLDAKTDVYQGN